MPQLIFILRFHHKQPTSKFWTRVQMYTIKKDLYGGKQHYKTQIYINTCDISSFNAHQGKSLDVQAVYRRKWWNLSLEHDRKSSKYQRSFIRIRWFLLCRSTQWKNTLPYLTSSSPCTDRSQLKSVFCFEKGHCKSFISTWRCLSAPHRDPTFDGLTPEEWLCISIISIQKSSWAKFTDREGGVRRRGRARQTQHMTTTSHRWLVYTKIFSKPLMLQSCCFYHRMRWEESLSVDLPHAGLS